MQLIIGAIVVFGCVAGGFVMHGGDLRILNQPNEFIIIGGSAIGAFVIANPGTILKGTLGSLKYFMKGKPFGKAQYVELLTFLFEVFKLLKTKGMLEIEGHIEDPHSSDIFTKYPGVEHNHHALDFFCDNLRLLTMGIDNHYQMDDLMTAELDVHHHETETLATAVTTLGDSFPALGIVAAVLGVITTMTSISEPPEILGGLIAAALVGTFLGILLAYGLVGPMGQFLTKYFHEEGAYYECIKVAILAHMQGNAPTVSVEFARKAAPTAFRPSFKEMEEALEGI